MSSILLFTLVPVFMGGLFGSIILLNLHNALIYDLIIEDIKNFIDKYIFFIPRKIKDIFLGWFNLIWGCLKKLWSYIIKAKNYFKSSFDDMVFYLTEYKNIVFLSGKSLGSSWFLTIKTIFTTIFYSPVKAFKRLWKDRSDAWKALTSAVSKAWKTFLDQYGPSEGFFKKIYNKISSFFGF